MLEKIAKKINKSFGEGSIITSSSPIPEIEVIPTNIPTLDDALGTGGFPLGRIVEVYGSPSTGKSTLGWMIVKNALERGIPSIYFDAEQANQRDYVEKILQVPIDSDLFAFSNLNNAEDVLNIIEKICQEDEIKDKGAVIVVDSVASLTTLAEEGGEIGERNIASLARIMSSSLKRIMPHIRSSKTLLLFLNQIRTNINARYTDPDLAPGGLAIDYFSAIKLKFQIGGSIKEGDRVVGTKVNVFFKKNKLAIPSDYISLSFIYGKGFDIALSWIMYLEKEGYVVKSGAWYEYDGEKFHGISALKEYIEDKLQRGNSLIGKTPGSGPGDAGSNPASST